jgi:hypothetical protein
MKMESPDKEDVRHEIETSHGVLFPLDVVLFP